MSLRLHNQSQACQIQKLIEREAWLLSEQAGEDITQTAQGLCLLNNRVAYLVQSGFGAWLNELETTEEI